MQPIFYSILLLFSFTTHYPCMATSTHSEPLQTSILSTAQTSEQPSTPTEPDDKKVPLHIPMSDEVHMPSYQGTFTKMLLTLAGLILVVFLTVWLLKKLMQGKIGSFGKKHISIIERRPISPKTVLYLIELEGKQILMAESQLEIKTLTTVDLPRE